MTKPLNSQGELPPSQHQTLSVFDHHYLDFDGLPYVHNTRQRIRALAPMTHLPYRFDTGAVHVEMEAGGEAGPLYVVREGIHAVDIKLTEPLRPGDETELEYSTLFDYSEAPSPLFRRVIGSRIMEKLDIHVVFDGRQLPTGVWQSEWDDYAPDSPITQEAPAHLTPFEAGDPGDMEEVYLSQENVSNRVIGFRWEWLGQA